MNDRPAQVTAQHRARKAIVYLRQSSDAQVRDHRGSTAYQRGQRDHARRWGWAPDHIEVIDEDLGLSGTTTIHRYGYQRLLRSIEANEVGCVLVSDESRLGRNPIEIFAFVNACLVHKVLLAIDGRIADLTDSGALFQTRLTALLNEHENLRRREHMRRGIAARLAAGHAVSRPPAGYVRLESGAWELDPDPDVQRTLALVFQTFLEQRSCLRVVRSFRMRGIKIPRRPSGRSLVWVEPTANNVFVILTNPNYTDRYVYRRHVCDPSRGYNRRGYSRIRATAPAEQVVVPNHHPPYISRSEWDEIQTILRSNSFNAGRPPLGIGSALLQGLLRCAQHPHLTMAVHYKQPRRNGTRRHAYTCMGEYHAGKPKCGAVSGLALDRAVAEAALDRLSPPSIAALRAAVKRARQQDLDRIRHYSSALERARRHERDVQHRFMLVDPSHRLVAADLEKQLEAAKQERARLEADPGVGEEMRPKLTAAQLDELEALTGDVASLFYATTTENRERKEILRALISDVTLVERSAEWRRLRITWIDGARPAIVTVSTPEHARREIVRLHARGATIPEICTNLARRGLKTKRRTAWTATAIRDVLRARRAR